MDKKFIEKLIIATCEVFQIHPSLLYEKCRRREVKDARWIIWEIVTVKMKTSLTRTGAIFGRYNHTSVLHALRELPPLLQTDDELLKKYKIILREMEIFYSDIVKYRRAKEMSDKKLSENGVRFVSDEVVKRKMLRYKKYLETKTA